MKKIIIIQTIILLVITLILITSINFVSAEQTQQYNKIFLNPYYTPILTKNINYNFNVSLSIPNGLTKISTSLITFQIYATSSPQDFTLKVNNKNCNNPIFTATSSGLTYVSFDCSNIIKDIGNYNIILSSTKDSGSAIGWLELTYINKPESKMNMLGTDYFAGDNGTIFLQLINDNRQAISNASCYLSAWYPDKSSFFYDVLMNYLAEGIYYYDVVIPDMIGVYMLSASCTMPPNTFSDNFINYNYISSYANVSISSGKIVLSEGSTTIEDSSGNGRDGTPVNMETSDWIVGKLGNAIDIDGVNEYINLGNIASFERTDNFSYEFWMKTNSTTNYQTILSKTPYGAWQGLELFIVTNKLRLYLLSGSQSIEVGSTAIVNNNNWRHIVITYNGTSNANDVRIYVDNVEGQYVYTNNLNSSIVNPNNFQISCRAGTYNCYKGMIDEVVIYNYTLNSTEISYRYNNGTGRENLYPNKTAYALYHLNISADTTSRKSGYIKSVGLYTENLLEWGEFGADYDNKQGNTSFSVLNSSGNTICSGLGNIKICAGNSSPIYLYANLSRINSSFISPEIDRWYITYSIFEIQEIRGAGELNVNNWGGGGTAEVNETVIAEAVWSYNGTIANNILYQIAEAVWNWSGSITQIIIDALTNQTAQVDLTDYDKIQEMTWNNSVRDLTYYELVNITNLTVNVNSSQIAQEIWNYEGDISSNIIIQFIDEIDCLLKTYFYDEEGWGIDIPVCN